MDPSTTTTSDAASTERVVTALYDYNSGEVTDLKFQAGDVIHVHSAESAEWLYGEVTDVGDGMTRVGMFPASFVTTGVEGGVAESTSGVGGGVVESTSGVGGGVVESTSGVVDATTGVEATAIYHFHGQQGELTFNCGDRIVAISAVSDDWWAGTHQGSGAVGRFPANHVQLAPAGRQPQRVEAFYI